MILNTVASTIEKKPGKSARRFGTDWPNPTGTATANSRCKCHEQFLNAPPLVRSMHYACTAHAFAISLILTSASLSPFSLSLFDVVMQNRGEFIRMLNEPPQEQTQKTPQSLARQLLQPANAAKRKEFAGQLQINEEHLTGLLTHMQHIPWEGMRRFFQFFSSVASGGGRPPAGAIVLTRQEEQSIVRVCTFSFLALLIAP